ncbi:bile acid:sodium symporter [Hoeflea sp. WL0058]|uniref:Bile acid:sodium symporter n=1 Tax=Flavimaribacter sediminis TaxID=2865987 RepID=A0AAE2ZP08_9HYPH|nr:bile acid:sodium symporter [Flavimaribacter sediminis]MBW8640098.1 bile acid:sodium symporter [Flavimaribacter sediminis]
MLVDLFLPAVLTVIMFSLGLGLTGADFSRVARSPGAFSLGAINQIVVVPLTGFFVATLFGLPPELAAGTMILALCPGGVMSNVATRMAGGSVPLSVSLTAVISLVSIVTLPVLTALSVRHFMGAEAPEVNVTALGLTMFLLTAVPVALGMGLTRIAPVLTDKIGPWMNRITTVLFAILILLALAANWATFTANIGTLGPALLTMTAVLLIVGLVTSRIAGLDARDTTTVAIESGIQNGTLGIAVGGIVAGVATGLPALTLPTAIYSVTAWVLVLPFIAWRRKLNSAKAVQA